MISVIIPTYNRSEVLPRAIESVEKQSLKKWELIIVNDGSTDSTKKFLENLNHKVIHQENLGVSAARNIAIEKAEGEWLAFLDSDDEWLPEKLAVQFAFIKNNPDIKIIHGDEIWIRNGVRVNQMKKHQKFGGRIFSKCLHLCLISPSCVMVHRSVFDDVGPFDPEMTVCEDYDLWLRITAKYNVGFVDKPLIKKFGGHPDQLSKKFKAMDWFRVRSILKLFELGYAQYLSVEEIEEGKKVFLRKAKILENGYLKHGHKDKAQEVVNLSDKFSSLLRSF